MSDVANLERRLQNREVILLDGAVGTQLQAMHVPMNKHGWAAEALHTHPFTVRRMHENYIAAGVDVITTDTYASARHNLEPLGLGDLTAELNLRAVMLAQDARDHAAKARPVYIAGSVSNFGLLAGLESYSPEDYAQYFAHRSEVSESQARANLREQADLLAEAGADLLLVEATGSTVQRKWVLEACAATGLPVWVGFKCHQEPGDATVRIGYCSEAALADEFAEVMALGGSVVTVFHTTVETSSAAIPVLRDLWKGPIGIYPEADRHDYVASYRDPTEETRVSPDDFVRCAKDWVDQGVQIIGGCCGIELDHIRPLREALPSHIP